MQAIIKLGATLLLQMLASVILTLQARCQEIKIGEHIPDIELRKLINYKSDKAKLSDFKGKSIILDFWTTYCSNCIFSFPKMDSLQNRFKNDLQIILITPQDSTLIYQF